MSIIKPAWHEISDGPFVAIQQVRFGNQDFFPGDEIPKTVKADGGRTVFVDVPKTEPVLNRRGHRQYDHLGKLKVREVQKVDAEGKPVFETKQVLEADGTPKVVKEERFVQDDQGNPVLDEDGNKTMETVETPVTEEVPVIETVKREVTRTCTVEWEIDVHTLLAHFNMDVIGPQFVEEREYQFDKEGEPVLDDNNEHVFKMVLVDCEWTRMWVEHYKNLAVPVEPEPYVDPVPEKYKSRKRKRLIAEARKVQAEAEAQAQAEAQTESEPDDETAKSKPKDKKAHEDSKQASIANLKKKAGIKT